MEKRAKVSVRGVVQGVGFRPFVYRHASEYALAGWVRNTSGAVEIEVEGEEESLSRFLKTLAASAPPRARIEKLDTSFHQVKGYAGFEIRKSLRRKGDYQLVSPDIATCEACRKETLSPNDRRYRYPFTNCTNCGPRFTIIKGIPYDRKITTMDEFAMCPTCQEEYDDPLDRRFHAQPNACPTCGPHAELVDQDGTAIPCDDPIRKAGHLLKEGKILAVKGLGGFHLTCDATNEEAIHRLRERKRRPSKPFAVMMGTLEEIERNCQVSQEERDLLTSPECPIVLLSRRSSGTGLSPSVAPSLRYLGVMLPYTPLHHILLSDCGRPLVMTSGNISGEPLIKENEDALRRLRGIADGYLLHNRKIHVRCDDSVCMMTTVPQVLRRARGYAPRPVLLPYQLPHVLGCGAEMRNTFCMTKESRAFVSPHIGDMENEETIEHFDRMIGFHERLFGIEPEIVACDMHPDYFSTKYALKLAERRGLPVIEVQHHHAHVVSCLADNSEEGPVIGVVFDGTGYGPDDTIWGGEFLVADRHGYSRRGHLERVPIPGGDAAIRKPYRMALSYLYRLLGEGVSLDGLPLASVEAEERETIIRQLQRGINAPFTSSAGRLFDAVSALIGLRGEIDYDAQAAIELEMAAGDLAEDVGAYPVEHGREGKMRTIGIKPLLEGIIEDVRRGVSAEEIAARFHVTVAKTIAEICSLISMDTGLKQVALTGGVFQNRLLLRLTEQALLSEGFDVLTHSSIPCNDGGVSLGQAVIAGSERRRLTRR